MDADRRKNNVLNQKYIYIEEHMTTSKLTGHMHRQSHVTHSVLWKLELVYYHYGSKLLDVQ